MRYNFFVKLSARSEKLLPQGFSFYKNSARKVAKKVIFCLVLLIFQ
jgi:hypothetical protein